MSNDNFERNNPLIEIDLEGIINFLNVYLYSHSLETIPVTTWHQTYRILYPNRTNKTDK